MNHASPNPTTHSSRVKPTAVGIRRSFDDAARGNPLAVVTAFASSTRLVIGQRRFRAADGDSEILAARALLTCLDLGGRLVTADAMHCQNETAELILARGGDYLLRLKANRPALHKDVAAHFADAEPRPAPRPPSPPTPWPRDKARLGEPRPRLARRKPRRAPSWHQGRRTAARSGPHSEHAAQRPPRGSARLICACTITRELAAARSLRLPAGRACTLVDRERPPPAPDVVFALGPGPQPQGPRTGKPRDTAQTRPQRPATSPTRHLHPPKTQTLRLVQRLRQYPSSAKCDSPGCRRLSHCTMRSLATCCRFGVLMNLSRP